MTNKILFIANWKMFGTKKTVKTINNVIKFSKKKHNKKAKIIYCPPYTLIDSMVEKTKNSEIDVGAQNCHFEKNTGPFTGSISADMIKESGAKFVIIGHSEVRMQGDTNLIINKKIINALHTKLKVIFCIGETLKEKKCNKAKLVLKKQLILGLKYVKNLKNIIFAYEPVWSIGTGKVLDSKNLKTQFLYLKKFLKKKYKVKKPTIVYGGSVNGENILNIKKINEIDGFLIGGASTNSKKFIDIIKKTIN